MKEIIAVLVAMQIMTFGILVIEHRETEKKLNEMGWDMGGIYERLYTLETGLPVPSQEEGE